MPHSAYFFHLFDGADLAAHMSGENWRTEPRIINSGVVFVDFHACGEKLLGFVMNACPSINFVGNYFGGKHILKPNESDAIKVSFPNSQIPQISPNFFV
jgi:hypothetical protein